MKKILFPLAISLVTLLLIGCQDNSMTNPVSSQQLNKTNPNQTDIVNGIIPLNYKLKDPVKSDIEYELIGDIDYTEAPITHLPSETIAEKDDKLTEAVTANLKIISSSDIKVNTWRIASESGDIVKFTSDRANILLKSYPIIGMANRMDLICQFIVTQNGEELTNVFLESPVVNNTGQSNETVVVKNEAAKINPL